ncbi:MAG: ABC transporter permease [Deltaproteobacteria bacterium]|nr:MAG: ABC transporter permease [Deltaproteobacteria bacterium]
MPFREVSEIARMLLLTVFYCVRRPIRWSEVIRQGYDIGNRSLVFVVAVLGFLGMILIFQSAYQAQQIVGDLQMLGALFLQLLFREFAPTVTALMIATRVGTGIAAEIGSMVVTEQVDALRMNNADPVQYLVVPRFISGVAMTFLLSTLAVVVCFLSGMWIASVAYDVNPSTFYNTSMLEWGDFIAFCMKATAYGVAIPVIACHAGLSAFGGSEGVGWATTKSVVNCSLAIVFLDFLLSGLAFVFLFS